MSPIEAVITDDVLLGGIVALACVMVGALIGILIAYTLWNHDPPEDVTVPDYVPDGWGSDDGVGFHPPRRPDAGGSS